MNMAMTKTQNTNLSPGEIREMETKIVSEHLAGLLLGQDPSRLAPPFNARMGLFQQKLRDQLVVAGRAEGASMSVERVLRELVGAEAMAHILLAGDIDLVLERIVGAPISSESQERHQRSRTSGAPPLRVFVKPGLKGSVKLPVVIAPDLDDATEFVEWALCDLALEAVGVTDEGKQKWRKAFGRKIRTFRVFIDGRIQRKRCVPLGLMLLMMRCLADRTEWLKPEARAPMKEYAEETGALLDGVLYRVLGVGSSTSPTSVERAST